MVGSNEEVLRRLRRLTTEMRQFTAALTSAQASDQASVSNLNPNLTTLESKFIEFSTKVSVFMSEVMEKMADQDYAVDDLEQYSRRNCLIFYKILEKPGEDVNATVINIIQKDLGIVDITEQDIDRAHRLKSNKQRTTAANIATNGSRPIIVKFARYYPRAAVFQNKKKLKGSNVSITESLTRRRLALLQLAKNLFGRERVWSQDGRIVILGGDNKKHYVTRENQLDDISCNPRLQEQQTPKN